MDSGQYGFRSGTTSFVACSMLIIVQYLHFITATAKIPAFQRYDIIDWACSPFNLMWKLQNHLRLIVCMVSGQWRCIFHDHLKSLLVLLWVRIASAHGFRTMTVNNTFQAILWKQPLWLAPNFSLTDAGPHCPHISCSHFPPPASYAAGCSVPTNLVF
jgi:hypothetical protein